MPQVEGAGGIPVSSSGRAMLLVSGGIDSPVAGYMVAKRGVTLEATYFHAPPYTSERAEEKVKELLARVSEYSGRMRLFTLPFTKIQETAILNNPVLNRLHHDKHCDRTKLCT